MTLIHVWDLQAALFEKLNKGLRVMVVDHVPELAPELYVRLEGFTTHNTGLKNHDRARHSFSVQAFQRPNGQSVGSVGLKKVTEIQTEIYKLLNHWQPFGAQSIKFEDSFAGAGEDGITAHASSRWSIQL